MRRKAGGGPRPGYRDRDSDDAGPLEIEFEDEDAPPAYPAAPAGQSRDLRPAAMASLAAVLLGAALWALHGSAADTGAGNTASSSAPVPNYAAYVVTVGYEGSRLLSLPQRRIEVDLRVAPVSGATVRIVGYYISENGVQVRADPPPSMTPLPASGTDVKLRLTVTDCAVVPIGESMSFVDVVADGPVGTIDRFTILGDQYSTDLARLLSTVCPGRPGGQVPITGATTAVVVAGSGS
jgi:hypothetical protein